MVDRDDGASMPVGLTDSNQQIDRRSIPCLKKLQG